jgi:hypothetical protein
MGLNRSYPSVYGTSAKRVLDLAPDRILAEHGGPYNFSAEDYRRRARWGIAAGKAADALCLSGHHEWDWNPNRIEFEPHLQTAKPGDKLKALLRVNTSQIGVSGTTSILGRGIVTDRVLKYRVASLSNREFELDVSVAKDVKPGRHIIEVRSTDDWFGAEGCDCYFAVDVVSP